MFFLICLSYYPDNEIPGLLPGTREQLEWDHIQHSYCLVYLGIKTRKIYYPHNNEAQNSCENVHEEDDRNQICGFVYLGIHYIFPCSQH